MGECVQNEQKRIENANMFVKDVATSNPTEHDDEPLPIYPAPLQNSPILFLSFTQNDKFIEKFSGVEIMHDETQTNNVSNLTLTRFNSDLEGSGLVLSDGIA